jgi:signal recognition particle GTPase
MGMPLYGMQPPTGYSMKADTWVNSSALLGRMNFALALTAGKLKGVQVDSGQMLNTKQLPTDAGQTLEALENSLLEGNVSKQTHDTIAAQLQDPKITQRKLDDPVHPPNVAGIAGLILGSPEFQRR